MNRQQATTLTSTLHALIHDVITIREKPYSQLRPTDRDGVARKMAGIIEILTDATKPAESCTCRAIDIPAADTAREIRPTSSTQWQTKDCAMLHTDKFYALWYCDGITGEILRMNGCLRHDGKLVELAGMDSASIDIGELYFWRVNCLKDQLAAQSTSTAVEVEYSDNAEMEVETIPEYE